MRRLVAVIAVSILFLSSLPQIPAAHAAGAVLAVQQHAYAKWGRLAVAETAKRYPGAQVVDYLHVGYRQVSPATGEETFKLWLRRNRREWGVYVRILFDTKSERVLSVSFRETQR